MIDLIDSAAVWFGDAVVATAVVMSTPSFVVITIFLCSCRVGDSMIAAAVLAKTFELQCLSASPP